MIREPIAIGSWIVVAAVSLMPEKMRSQAPGFDAALTAAVFFVAAGATRYWLQETRTREQILAFVAAGVGLAIVRTSIDGRALSLAGLVAGAAGASAGALLVKFGLEGLPF